MEQWFFDDELTRLRLEWVELIREYGRSRCPRTLRRAHEAHQRYVERADRLRKGADRQTPAAGAPPG
jgi:hypothetical protein